MDVLKLTAPAKINLTLDVLGKRPDGYHDLATVMHEIPLKDDITITIGGNPGIRASTNVRFIKKQTNIATKAAALLVERLGIENAGIDIEILKRIPVGAGLGGGSTDAAAVLLALHSFYRGGLDSGELLALGARIGADVPFCMTGGCALCEGIGERITPQPTIRQGSLVLIKPRVSISTAELFSEYNAGRRQMHPDTPGMLKALAENNFDAAAKRVYNVLEEAAEKKCEDISVIHKELLLNGADGACMSGSGSSVFGLFKDNGEALKAAEYFKSRYKDTFLLIF